jgi:peroxiredoxin family protein
MERKLGIVFASGATNRICCLAVYSAEALASGYKVYIHLVNEGLVAFRKDVLPRLLRYLLYVETYLKNLRGAVDKGPSRLGTTY